MSFAGRLQTKKLFLTYLFEQLQLSKWPDFNLKKGMFYSFNLMQDTVSIE